MTFDQDGLRQWLVDYLVDNIGLSPDEIDCDATLNDLAVGSADAVVLTGELAELLGRPVSPIEFWQYPTINALSTFLTGGEIEPVYTLTAAADAGMEREAIAVIGIGCRYPGGVNGPDELWDFITAGRSGVREVPEERWAWFADDSPETAAALAGTSKWGGFLDDVAAFDAEFFDIPAAEADKRDDFEAMPSS